MTTKIAFLIVPLMLAGCVSAEEQKRIAAQENAAMEAKFVQLNIAGTHYCLENGEQPGTQHLKDCIREYGNRRLTEEMLLNAPPPVVYSPSPPPVQESITVIAPAAPTICRTTPTGSGNSMTMCN